MDDNQVAFGAFDPKADMDIRVRNLPHWFQPGVAVFITFRTIDSLPREVIDRMRRELSDWLLIKGMSPTLAELSYQPPSAEHQAAFLSLSKAALQEFKKFKDRLLHFALDECHGRCLLQNRELAKIVANAILYGNGNQYDVESFVVMPNHVHAIAQFYKESSLSIVGQSWMRYTARQINASMSESGAFWQPEPFDHLIRSGEQFRYLQHYIADNPRKARLGLDSTVYWSA